MAQRAGQDYCAQTKHLAVRVHFGRDSQTGTRKQHNQTIYSRFREVPALPQSEAASARYQRYSARLQCASPKLADRKLCVEETDDRDLWVMSDVTNVFSKS
jgi:hypothetical protein